MAEPTGADRISGYYKSRMETIGALIKAENIENLDELTGDEIGDVVNERNPQRDRVSAEDIRERAHESITEMPLAVEVVRVLKITLGTGGPGDWFEATIDEEGDIGRIRYHFNEQ